MLNLLALSALLVVCKALNLPSTPLQQPLQLDKNFNNNNCPLDIPLSCSNSTPIADSCCFEYPGGVMLQTQFWDYYPPIGPLDKFTLHGLWPDNCDGSYEQFCDASLNVGNVTDILVEFNEVELLQKMKQIWKNFNGDDEHLWQHEYNKHGTCMNTLSPTCYGSNYKKNQNVVDFFKVSVELYEKLPTFNWLADAGIVPSYNQTYTKAEIESILTEKFGEEVFISCNKYNALQEIWYFYHLKGSVKSSQFIPISALSNSKCPETGIKFLPKDKKPQFPTPTQKPISPTSVPVVGKGFLKLSGLDGCIIGNGHWYTMGTCASFNLIKSNYGGYNLKSSKGFCGINKNGELSCDSKIEPAQFQFDKESKVIRYGGRDNWSVVGNRSGSRYKQNSIQPGDDGDIVFQLKFSS